MDKYDLMIESERDYEADDYYYQHLVRDNLETKEKQMKHCWEMRNNEKRQRKFLQ